MNLNLGRIKGIKIQIHFTFWLIVIWGAFQDGAYGAFKIMLLFGIVLLHELGHSFAAMRFGIAVRDITLLPIGGLARLERMPDKPRQEFIVAIAGPAVNLVLGLVMLPVLWWVTEGQLIGRWMLYRAFTGPSLSGLITYLFVVNLSLLIFNMIPAFPLDGGRVFRALLAIWLGYDKATRAAVWLGQGFAIFLGIWGIFVLKNFFLAIIALFIFSVGGIERQALVTKSVLQGVRVRQVLSRVGSTVLQPNFTIMEVSSLTRYSHQNNFPVMLGDILLGVIGQKAIRKALEGGKGFATVSEMMEQDVPEVNINAPLMEAQERLVESNSHVAAVYDERQFMGLVSFEDIERAFRTFATGSDAKPQIV